MLEAQRRPTALAELVALSGLHENTIRGHLDGLAAEGLVHRQRQVPDGRGRPGWLWQATSTPAGEYAALAATLARTLRTVSTQPEEDAREAGLRWGRSLAADRTTPGAAATPTSRVVDLLDELGFAPDGEFDASADTADVRLRRCPLLDAAKEETAIVCNVHLGLVLGALKRFGAPDPDAELYPFAEAGACPLRLRGGKP